MEPDAINNFFKILIANRIIEANQSRANIFLELAVSKGTDSDALSRLLEEMAEAFAVHNHVLMCLADFTTDDYRDFEFYSQMHEQ